VPLPNLNILSYQVEGGANQKASSAPPPPDSKIDQFRPLFTRILEWGQQNLVFLVQAPEGPRGLPLPLPVDTCCFGLTVRGKRHLYEVRADQIFVEAEPGTDSARYAAP